MSKRWIWMLGLVFCTMIAGLAVADGNYGVRELTASELKGKAPAERVAMQQAYKARLEDAARKAGWEPGERRAFTPAGREAQAGAVKALGSITYHSGALGTCCLNSQCVGNQFDSALDTSGTVIAPVMMSGTITMATYDMISVGGTGAFLSVFDQQNATTANLITSALQSGVVAGLNTATVSLNYVGSSFLMGIWQFNTDVPAVATGTVGGQGFHGMSINDVVATAFTTLPGTNAAMTAGGNILTPVELLNFEVD